jgi:hypothetical protein
VSTTPKVDQKTSMERQISILSRILEPKWKGMIELFEEKRYEENYQALNAFVKDTVKRRGYGVPCENDN